MAYYVAYSDCTTDEPSPGWYATRDTDDGEERAGPFSSKADALDWESDGAYSEWLESRAEERREQNYRDDMRAAGRGHLLHPDD